MSDIDPTPVLPDPLGAQVVLVGTAKYATLEDLPAVERNLATLRSLFTDPDLWGVPDKQCTTLLNPLNSTEVLDAVHVAAAAATSALVFYFSGHGLLDERGDLHLAVRDADVERVFRGVRYDRLRHQMVETGRDCPGRVVLLDCCYSGRAAGAMGSVSIADQAAIDGTYVMTSSPGNGLALAPLGEHHTAFTGALVECLTTGVEDGPELLDLVTVYHQVRKRLRERGMPQPQQRTVSGGGSIALVRNRRGAGGPSLQPPLSRARRLVPTADGVVVRARPHQLIAMIGELPVEERSEALRAFGAHARPETVASVVNDLRAGSTEPDRRCVLSGAAMRDPGDVAAVTEALRITGLPNDARELLMTVGQQPVDEAALFAAYLRPFPADLATVLDAALAKARDNGAVSGLINALWLAGLRHEVDDLLVRASADLAGPEIVAIADELRVVGRQQAAFTLYELATAELVRQPASAMVPLVAAMAAQGHTAAADRITNGAIDAARSAPAVIDLISAFAAAGQVAALEQLVAHTAVTLDDHELVAVADDLLDGDLDGTALDLLNAAAGGRGAASTRSFVAALREAGMPVGARRLLETAAGTLGVSEVVELVRLLADEIDSRDLEYVLGVVDVHPQFDMLFIGTMSDAAVDRLLAIVVRLPAAARRNWLTAAAGSALPPTLAKVLRLIVELPPGDMASVVLALPQARAGIVLWQAIEVGKAVSEPALAALRATRHGNNTDPVFTLLTATMALPAALLRLAAAGQITETVRFVTAAANDHTTCVDAMRTVILADMTVVLRHLVVATADRPANGTALGAGLADAPHEAFERVCSLLADAPLDSVAIIGAGLSTHAPARMMAVLRTHAGRMASVAPRYVMPISVVVGLLAVDAVRDDVPMLNRIPDDPKWVDALSSGLYGPPAEMATRVLRLLDTTNGARLLAASATRHPRLFDAIIDRLADQLPDAAPWDHSALAAQPDNRLVALAARRLATHDSPTARWLLDELGAALAHNRPFYVAEQLAAEGHTAAAAALIGRRTHLRLDGAIDVQRLAVAEALFRTGPLSSHCSTHPVEAAAVRLASKWVQIQQEQVLYVIRSHSRTPLTFFTDTAVYNVGGRFVHKAHRLPYESLPQCEFGVFSSNAVCVTEPPGVVWYWETWGTGVTPKRLVSMLTRIQRTLGDLPQHRAAPRRPSRP